MGDSYIYWLTVKTTFIEVHHTQLDAANSHNHPDQLAGPALAVSSPTQRSSRACPQRRWAPLPRRRHADHGCDPRRQGRFVAGAVGSSRAAPDPAGHGYRVDAEADPLADVSQPGGVSRRRRGHGERVQHFYQHGQYAATCVRINIILEHPQPARDGLGHRAPAIRRPGLRGVRRRHHH